jgi:hypothetical protein
MSAVLAQATATFASNGASITLSASNADDLIASLAKFGIAVGAPAANDTKANTAKGATPTATTAPTPAPTKTPEPTAGNASASTGTQASAPAAASGSAPAGEAPADERPRYSHDDIKNKVLALAKKSRELALTTLGQFKNMKGEPVDHGNKLKLEDYAAFIAAADKALAA